MRTIVFVIAFIGFIIQASSAQEYKDSVKTNAPQPDSVKAPGIFSVLFKGKPGKAFIYSLILPGAGQVYNKSYWKVPIIYTGLGLLIYSINFNSKEYNRFDNAYHLRVDLEKANAERVKAGLEPLNPTDEFKDVLTLTGINSYRQFYDKNLQLSYIGIGLVYLLNGIEAFVDRHLQDFDVSKNLSFQYAPSLYSAAGQVTLRLTF
jgi:hypothetical protein